MREIDTSSPEGHAFWIMGAVWSHMAKSGHGAAEIKNVIDDMMSSDYEHVLRVAEASAGLVFHDGSQIPKP